MFALVAVSAAALVLAGVVVALIVHPYAASIGWRYLRGKKRQTVSVVTVIAILGVALGVTALLAVTSITSGFQDEFRNKVLGVNAHVLVLKYGLDFEEYPEVISRAREMPEVRGAAPFLINQMMLAKGDRISGVLVKGVDPELMPDVLDLPSQLTQGSLRGLRGPHAAPPVRPEDLLDPVEGDWNWLQELAQPESEEALEESLDDGEDVVDAALGEAETEPAEEAELLDDAPDAADEGLDALLAEGDDAQPLDDPDAPVVLPEVDVPTPEEAEAALEDIPTPELPDDALLDQFLEEDALVLEDQGGRIPLEELPGIVVGTSLATNLGLGVGDRVQVISPLAGLDTSMWSGTDNTPRSREFRVIGIFEAGFQEYDSRLVYVDLFEAQHFFEHGDSVTGVEITLNEIDRAPEVSRRLERVLGGGPYHTMDWQELNHNLFTALEIQKVILSIVIASIIIVAAFCVIATLIMIVLEKKREIAILKAMGARFGGVMLIFMVQGLLIGLVGTVLGLLLGGGVCWYLAEFEFPLDPSVYLIDHLPVRASASEFLVTVSIAILICLGATVIPSYWAARLLPADGVRYE
ncbi:MAG: ABC transporter permease [Myxococcota bacterium]|nr:ABC transporter permease [Myxococcota bacterium]